MCAVRRGLLAKIGRVRPFSEELTTRSFGPVNPARWVLLAAASVFVGAATYVAAVWTAAGQAMENAALRGADQVGAQDLSAAREGLGQITVYSLAAAIVVVALVGLFRRRIDLSIAGVGIIILGQVITQGLKRFILPRPPLVEVYGDYTSNSFPSGHTTIAMTVLLAAIIVAPYRWRTVVILVGLPWAWGIGAFTITAKWHRLSDIVGADAVALFCACLASWWLATRGDVTRAADRPLLGRKVVVSIFAAFTTAAAAVGAMLFLIPASRGTDLSHVDAAQDYTAYLAAHALATGLCGLTALIFLWSWRHLQTGGSPDGRLAVVTADIRS